MCSLCVSVCVFYLQGFVLQGGQPGRGVSQYVEMRGGWGSHGEGPALCVHLVVNQTPLLQKRMNPGHRENFSLYLFTGVSDGKLPPQMIKCK